MKLAPSFGCAIGLIACVACTTASSARLEDPDSGAGAPPYDDGFAPSPSYWDAGGDGSGDASTFVEGPVRVFAFGSTTCALLPGATLKCWGRNTYGLVGNGDPEERDVVTPSAVAGISPTTVGGGAEHVCVSDGAKAWCWGRDEFGALGRGATRAEEVCKDGLRCSLFPREVPGLSGIRQIASGDDFSCALLLDRTVRCWGRNDLGQLGTPPEGAVFANCSGVPCSTEPRAVPGLEDVEQIALGATAGCARSAKGEIRCWGRLYDVTYEIGSNDVRYVAPVTAPTMLDVRGATDMSLGEDHACVIYGTSGVGCIGANRSYQCIDNGEPMALELLPRPLEQSPLGFYRLALGGLHSCGVTRDQTAHCWGATADGQIPTSCVNPAGKSVLFSNFFGVSDISAGALHTCLARTNGEVHCFGRNDHGQLSGEIVGRFECFDTTRNAHIYRRVTGLL